MATYRSGSASFGQSPGANSISATEAVSVVRLSYNCQPRAGTASQTARSARLMSALMVKPIFSATSHLSSDSQYEAESAR